MSLGYENGKRKWKYIYGKTWREVSDQLKVDLHTQQQGLPITIERQTVGEFLSKWLEDSARPRVRPKKLSEN
ncbi:MAG: hypothetical protein WCD37_08420 [Chloroflexia bacterium]